MLTIMGEANREPSMEEILASIKRIIAEDGVANPVPPEPRRPGPRLATTTELPPIPTLVRNHLAQQGMAEADDPDELTLDMVVEDDVIAPDAVEQDVINQPGSGELTNDELVVGEELSDELVVEDELLVENELSVEDELLVEAPIAPVEEPAAAIVEAPIEAIDSSAAAELPEPEISAVSLEAVPAQEPVVAAVADLAVVSPAAQPVVDGPVSQEPEEQRKPEEVLELTDKFEDTRGSAAIVSDTALAASRGSLAALSALIVKPEPATDPRTLEGMVAEMLKPMLKEWLDAKLPELVEAVVSREVARITGRVI